VSPSARIAEVLAPLVNNNEPEAQVIELLVAEGARVSAGDVLCVLETSKTAADVEAPVTGHVGRLRVSEGDMVAAGTPICEIFDGPPPEDAGPAAPDGDAPRLTRKARALLDEAGVTDLSSLPRDRFVTAADVEALIAQRGHGEAVELDPALLAAIGPRSIAVFGGGGLGRCVIELIRASGAGDPVAVIDDGLAPGGDVLGVPLVGGASALPGLAQAGLARVAHAVGGVGRMAARAAVARTIAGSGLEMPALVDPSATVSPSAVLEPGAQVHAGARLMAQAAVGPNVLINTGAVVSHDCRIEAHSHIAPGAILAGDVHVGEETLVGMGATVLLGVGIGARCIVGNGAHVLADVPDDTRVGVGQVWTGRA
jgi:sugar O-acyltransferase (sialic acid O-acetyltransferase NeuD family)